MINSLLERFRLLSASPVIMSIISSYRSLLRFRLNLNGFNQTRKWFLTLNSLFGLNKPYLQFFKKFFFLRSESHLFDLLVNLYKSANIVLTAYNFLHRRILLLHRIVKIGMSSDESGKINKLYEKLIEFFNRDAGQGIRMNFPDVSEGIRDRKEAFHELPIFTICRLICHHLNHILVRIMEKQSTDSNPGGLDQ